MPLPRIRVHPAGRYLMTEDGAPFFWLGDTAWNLFARLSPSEAEYYLQTRAQQGFNVLQITVLAELDGLRVANPNGDLPFIDGDPLRPNEPFFGFVDSVVRRADELGLYVALLPVWGDKLTPAWGDGPPLFFENPAAFYAYGAWLGERYREQSNVIWMLGGDRPPIVDERHPDGSPAYDYRPLWRDLARGIIDGMGSKPLMAYHTWGGLPRTSQQIHNEDWLDINAMQSGHGSGHDVPVWEWIEEDWALEPAKPTLDLEPNYEDHPVNPWPTWNPQSGYFRESDVRRQIYRSVFAGACGVTYGHHSVWQFCSPRYAPINYACVYWTEALKRPAATQVQHLRHLIESRPLFERIPNQAMIVEGQGEGRSHLRATSDTHGRYAFVFFPAAVDTAVIDLSPIAGKANAAWYDTHTGITYPIGILGHRGTQRFTTPLPWHDWVLVLDSSAHG